VVTAIVLLKVRGGQAARIAREIGTIPDVTEVLSTAGAFDLVVRVQVQEYEHMSEVITERLQSVEGIERTETLMAFHTYKF
jgi:anthranilate phosphoribosyltransferase